MADQIEAVSREVARILAEADEEIAGRGAVCRGSGRCCRFEEWGHRLYVTTAELVHFVRVHGAGGAGSRGRVLTHASGHRDCGQKHGTRDGTPAEGGSVVALPQLGAGVEGGGCPYQEGRMCGAREARPLGCRVYFCDETAAGWQNEVYEKYHARLRALHERLGVAYRYVEWRVGLGEWAGRGAEDMMEALWVRPT